VRLAAESLVVRRGNQAVFSGLCWTLEPGARALVTGAAQSGKTTLLKALAGLVPAEAGCVTWDGRAVSSLDTRGRRALQSQFGLVFQSDALFDSRTVLDNVLLPLVRRGVSLDAAHERATTVLADVGLASAAALLPEVLSGGMRKRVGIARAVVARPAVILADDPFSGLDPATAAEVGRVLSEAAAGRTLVVAAPEPFPWIDLPQRLRLAP
jgi:phospholipid/cholesterol/gamma-HCH transport system ATP-binding protein